MSVKLFKDASDALKHVTQHDTVVSKFGRVKKSKFLRPPLTPSHAATTGATFYGERRRREGAV